jgi:hypothetical protein
MNGELNNIKLGDSQIERTCFSGGSIIATNMQSSTIMGGFIDNVSIQPNCKVIFPEHGPKTLFDTFDYLQNQITILQQQNNFLLKLLVQKNVLTDEKEVQELIDAYKLAEKLSEDDKSAK